MRTRLAARCLLAAALGLAALPAGAQFMPERQRLLFSGRYAELEKLSEKEVLADPKPNSARLIPLCVAYAKLKRYNRVFPCLDRLEGNVRAGDIALHDVDEMQRNSPLLAGLARFGSAFAGGEDALKGTVVPFMHLTRAEVLMELREYDKALAAANEAYRTIPQRFQEERSYRVFTLAAIGLIQALSGDRDKAIKTAAALEEIGTSYPYGLLYGPKWLGVIRIRVALGDFKTAHEIFQREDLMNKGWFTSLALGVGGGVAGLKDDESFTGWTDLPLEFLKYKMELEVGKVKEAKAGFDKLLARREIAGNGEIYWVLLYDRGRIAAQEGDLPAALEYWRRAIEVIEEQRATINTEASKIGFVGDKQAVYRALIAGLVARERHAEAFDFVERSKARALVDLLAAKKDFAVASPDAEEVRRLLASAEQQELEARAQAGAPAARSAPQAMQALREKAPELASLVSVGAAPLAEIQTRIADDEALLEYYYDEGDFYAFVVTRESLAAVKLDGATLEPDVRALRKALEAPVGEEHAPLGRKLHATLIRPLEPRLADKKSLLVVPHGALHYLPFAALRAETGHLLDAYALRFLPSASVLRYLRSGGAPGRAGILALGNPDLGDPRMDLQFAEEEARAIAQKFPQSRALLRKEATETAVRQFAAGFSILHFATHGEFKADAPLESALLLARDAQSDGLLSVGKLYALRFDADLVTLSACETGLGKVASGDDVVGLTRGFLYAGASTVVASLWKVDDLATAALMTRFYDELRSGDRRQALRAAQLATREKFPHPFYWAAFQLTGSFR